jgi:hypothetical protein
MKTGLRLTIILLALTASSLRGATHYVSQGSSNPTPPYTNWSTAATGIQQAVDIAEDGDTVLVTNGVFAVGQREMLDGHGNSLGFSRVLVPIIVCLRSVNGPEVTVIDGTLNGRCVSLAVGASVTGFTLRGGSEAFGGGVWSMSAGGLVTNCVIVGNQSRQGGGAAGCQLYGCALMGNSADTGGGAWACVLYNCSLSNNIAYNRGGRVDSSRLYNCILTPNSASYGGGVSLCSVYDSTLTRNSGGGGWGSRLYNSIVYFN